MVQQYILKGLEEMIQRELKGCIITSSSGIPLYTPDGVGNYHALWTRDFSYMVEYAGEFIPVEHIGNCIEYLLENVRDEDGWIPDRVDDHGIAVYAAGSMEHPCGEANLDNGPFLCMLMDCYLSRLPLEEARRFFIKWGDHIQKGLEIIPKDENNLVYNNPVKPHSPYGFTDCICKTGSLMIESLLLWRAYGIFSKWQSKFNLKTYDLQEKIKRIEDHLIPSFLNSDGMFDAATHDCRQTDVWGTCYAVSINFPLENNIIKGIVCWLKANYEGVVKCGQVRHNAPGSFWEKCLVDVSEGRYQNGAYWATAAGWLVETLMKGDMALAEKTLIDLCEYFNKYGIYECVNGDYRQLNHYVVSVTNIYPAAKKLSLG